MKGFSEASSRTALTRPSNRARLHHHVGGPPLPKRRLDFEVVIRNLIQNNPLLLQQALAHEAFSGLEMVFRVSSAA